MTERSRGTLPIPDRGFPGAVTYDAKDPGHGVPADRAAAPAGGRAERADRAARRRRLRRVERVRRAGRHADGRAAGGRRAEVHALPHDGAVLADAGRAAVAGATTTRSAWAGSPRSRPSAPGYSSMRPEHVRAAGRDPQAQRLRDGARRQVPRGAGVGDQPGRPVRSLAQPGNGFEYFYGFIGGETNQYYPALHEGTKAVEPARDARAGLPPDGGPGRPRDRVGAPAEGAHARPAVLPVLRARRDAHAAPRAQGVGGPVQGPVRRRLGRAARADLRAPAGARRDPGGRRADRAPRRDPRVGGHGRARSGRCSPARWRTTPASSSSPTTTSAG